MLPLIVMMVVCVVLRGLGAAGLAASASSWSGSLRFALAAMFLFTAVSHFLPRTRPELVRMVPHQLPHAELLVTLTGLFELAGAIGLIVAALTRLAAWLLALLLVLMFPANIHAARAKLLVGGRRATPMSVRLPLQVFWIAALLWVAEASKGS
jgi:uncharacterized membrane protein